MDEYVSECVVEVSPDDTAETVALPLISSGILAISKSQICGSPLWVWVSSESASRLRTRGPPR